MLVVPEIHEKCSERRQRTIYGGYLNHKPWRNPGFIFLQIEGIFMRKNDILQTQKIKIADSITIWADIILKASTVEDIIRTLNEMGEKIPETIKTFCEECGELDNFLVLKDKFDPDETIKKE